MKVYILTITNSYGNSSEPLYAFSSMKGAIDKDAQLRYTSGIDFGYSRLTKLEIDATINEDSQNA